MTLLQLKYIVKIVECGSMNEASHALYVSQPALSSSVKELENELGIEIFTRSSQGIALTVDGAEFLTYARQVLDQADLLEERYKHAKPRKQLCQVSTQHYMFAVEAFVEIDQLHQVRRIRVHHPRDPHARHHQPGRQHAVRNRHHLPVRF